MLNKIIKVGLVILMTMVIFHVASAQQLKKFYEGDRYGSIEYTYIDGEDGQRIYEGDYFCKKHPSFGASTVYGHFKNNHQVGQWIKEDKYDRMIFNFNDSGYLDGLVTITKKSGYHSGQSSTMLIDQKNNKITFNNCYAHNDDITVNATIKDRIFVGPYECKIAGCGSAKGQYNDEGIPVGKWVFDKNYVVVFDKDGEMEQFYYINSRTGDKNQLDHYAFEEKWGRFTGYMSRIPDLFFWVQGFLMRDSKKLNEKIFEQPQN